MHMTEPGTYVPRAGDVVVRTAKSLSLVLAPARWNQVCEDCRAIIPRGELHGSRPRLHICLKCVTPTRPIS